VLAGEEILHLHGLGSIRELTDRPAQIVVDRLALTGQLEQRLGVLEQPAELPRGVDARREPRAILLEPLRSLGVGPDLGQRQLELELGQGRLFAVDIKGTSAARRPCSKARRSARRSAAGLRWPTCALPPDPRKIALVP
jgi:hypothetical protein